MTKIVRRTSSAALLILALASPSVVYAAEAPVPASQIASTTVNWLAQPQRLTDRQAQYDKAIRRRNSGRNAMVLGAVFLSVGTVLALHGEKSDLEILGEQLRCKTSACVTDAKGVKNKFSTPESLAGVVIGGAGFLSVVGGGIIYSLANDELRALDAVRPRVAAFPLTDHQAVAFSTRQVAYQVRW